MITLELKEKNAHHRWENKQHHLTKSGTFLTKSGTFRSIARKKPLSLSEQQMPILLL
jgi:hypothetical protein